jgi:predicted phosphodiesterase
MRYLLLSDIHADQHALDTVLKHANEQGWDHLAFLGDAVGYGHQPEEVVQRLISLDPFIALQGNHEVMILNAAQGNTHGIPETMRALALDHAARLSSQSMHFLANLPQHQITDTWGAVHGALRQPWEYLISVPVARANQPLMHRPLYFVGHTHVPGAFMLQDGRWRPRTFKSSHERLDLQGVQAAFVNPGSVSNTRDEQHGMSYAIFDEPSMHVDVYRLQR